ncbi:hypothetical protein KLA_07582 [Cellulophaga geojensis KL-A]|uniref:FeoB-associated Cys-rich membrane protein n=1 Tax=Cellulophaga geojensis KL-A TaxID=1328323 RepID=A0ABP3B7U9_9FLAO|nr:hypothetical protein [Cellulophaga geojensis]EWH13895.1 hypothetical protein KLA_07582 [Cellulophaga geojensis KL-A]
METLQHILVFITATIAFGYIAKKFFLPKSLFTSNKSKKSCGSDNCGCS